MTETDIGLAAFTAYFEQDREAAEGLYAEDFVFTSPQDDRIDRATFFERCFPTMERVRHQELIHVVPADGGDVFVLYEYELHSGERHRNAEVVTVREEKVVETQVFFGGRVHS